MTDLKIVSIKRRKGSRSRVRVKLSDGPELDLSSEVVVRAGLRTGQLLQASDVEALERDEIAWRCRESALRLLAHRPRSQRELRQRLSARAFPAEVVDACVGDLERAGLIDDESFAHLAARDRVRNKSVGKIRLQAELRAKGVDPETASEAIDAALVGEDGGEAAVARRAAGKFRRREGEDLQSAKRRLFGFLARRGFAPDIIYQTMDEVLPADE